VEPITRAKKNAWEIITVSNIQGSATEEAVFWTANCRNEEYAGGQKIVWCADFGGK
jgi:hypothetical protein